MVDAAIVGLPAKGKGTSNGEKPPVSAEPPSNDVLLAELRKHIELIDKAVDVKDLRIIARVLRQTGVLRRRLNLEVLSIMARKYLAKKLVAASGFNLEEDGEAMEVEKPHSKKGSEATAPSKATPEAVAYIQLLRVMPSCEEERSVIVILLVDTKQYEKAIKETKSLVDFIANHNRRTMDGINSRAFFFFARAHELGGSLASIRMRLLTAYRTASLRHDYQGQEVILNLLLRNYIHYRLYDQADKMVERTEFPETRSNNQLARYLYYCGRLKAIQLDYTEAYERLLQAQRKAPQSSALGFRIIVQKFMIIVQLLMGEIPERSVFRQSKLARALQPYLALTMTVRVGDLAEFRQVTQQYGDVFKKDETMPLISRLRHNVIKAGLKKINMSYSRISLADIGERLGLESAEDAEGVVAKAIRDGVIEATINHDEKYMRSKQNLNNYATNEPTNAYNYRIQFCLDIYSEAIRAMRFPQSKEDESNAEARRERLKEEQELAKTLEEDEDDLDDDF